MHVPVKERISVFVAGYVKSGGTVELATTATVRSAIARQAVSVVKENPSGVITIRSKRKVDGHPYVRRRLNYLRHPSDLTVSLNDLDHVIVQFKIPRHS